MPLEPGARLDAYEIVRPLGSGGMGEVWLATEVRLGRKVALKLLPADVTRDASPVLRFEQEARAASGLSHPNVCTIHALGETPDGLRYIAMEYVEGETLRQRLAVPHEGARVAEERHDRPPDQSPGVTGTQMHAGACPRGRQAPPTSSVPFKPSPGGPSFCAWRISGILSIPRPSPPEPSGRTIS